MNRISVNSDGSIGPFRDAAAAEEWMAARLALLSALAGQKGAPRFSAHDDGAAGGDSCTNPAAYDSGTDTVWMHGMPTVGAVLDLAAVDGMLLHALGHRAQHTHTTALRWLGWLAGGVVGTACIAAFEDSLTVPLKLSLTALAGLGILYTCAAARRQRRAEAMADEYALRHGGPRPILTFLRRMSGDPATDAADPRARPGLRIAHLESLLWADASLPPTRRVSRRSPTGKPKLRAHRVCLHIRQRWGTLRHD